MTYTDDEIKEAKRRDEAATVGPFVVSYDQDSQELLVITEEPPVQVVALLATGEEDDAAFIAAARTGWPKAVAEVERLRVALANAQSEILSTTDDTEACESALRVISNALAAKEETDG